MFTSSLHLFLAGYKMHKRVGEIEEFGFDRMEQSDNNNEPESMGPICQQLHISILISGWLKDDGYVNDSQQTQL